MHTSLAFFPNFTQCWFIALKTDHSFCIRNPSYQCHIVIELVLMCLNCNWCKLKHTQTFLYYSHVTRLLVSCTLKSFQERHSHTIYIHRIIYITEGITRLINRDWTNGSGHHNFNACRYLETLVHLENGLYFIVTCLCYFTVHNLCRVYGHIGILT
jgi:hypothetical protein